jgi:hypothetical protein
MWSDAFLEEDRKPPFVRRVVLLRGIRSDGENDVGVLGVRLERMGWEVTMVDLEMTKILTSRNSKLTRKNLEIMRLVCRPGDHVVAHSNGARLAWYAMQTGFRFGRCAFFGPALDGDVVFPVGAYESVDVWHNLFDLPVWLGSLRPWHRWGAMGALGYRGISPRVVNHSLRGWRRLGHGHYFVGDNADALAVDVNEIFMGGNVYDG